MAPCEESRFPASPSLSSEKHLTCPAITPTSLSTTTHRATRRVHPPWWPGRGAKVRERGPLERKDPPASARRPQVEGTSARARRLEPAPGQLFVYGSPNLRSLGGAACPVVVLPKTGR